MSERFSLASKIDHTLLEQGAPQDFMVNFAKDCVRYQFRAACVRAGRVAWLLNTIQGTEVRPCAAVGFRLLQVKPTRDHYRSEEVIPRYHISLDEKCLEIQSVFDVLDRRAFTGAVEFDITLNVFRVLRGEPAAIEEESKQLVAFCRNLALERGRDTVVKLIAENYLLQPELRPRVWAAIQAAGADFVKTSTGFVPAGVTIEEVAAMRAQLGSTIGIKAAGGVTQFNYQSFLDAGATRIGSSRGVEIIEMTQLKA